MAGKIRGKHSFSRRHWMVIAFGFVAFLLTGLALRWFGEMRFAYLFFAAVLLLALLLSRFLRMDRRNG